jgi:hypothetical protein
MQILRVVCYIFYNKKLPDCRVDNIMCFRVCSADVLKYCDCIVLAEII